MKEITDEKLEKYFKITRQAFEKAKAASSKHEKQKQDILEMVENYISDAEHFKQNNDFVNAFAALSYAHGWLDAGAKLKIYDVKDSRLFAGID